MTSLSDASASDTLGAMLRQRARLLDAVWSDLQDERRAILLRCFPQTPAFPRITAAIDGYAADLACAPDGSWRVTRDHVGRHPGARVLGMPVLAVFLPALCRALLGQSLRLASLPVWWLGDRATLPMLAADPARFCLRDAVDAERPPLLLRALSAADRRRLQPVVDAEPGRYVATLDPSITVSSSHRLQCEINDLFRT